MKELFLKLNDFMLIFWLFAITSLAGYYSSGLIGAILIPIFVFGLTALFWFGLEKLLLR